MTKRLGTIFGTGLLAVGLLAGQTTAPAPGQPNGAARVRKHRAGKARILKQLDLTADQKAQAKQFFRSSAEANKAVREQMVAARAALRDGVKTNAPDAEIDRLSQNVGSLRAQATANHAKAMAKLYTILTPEQRGKLDQHQTRGFRRSAALQ